MIYKCMNCSAALLFKPKSGMLECDSCGSAFWASQFEETTKSNEKLQMDYYSCTACGAEIAVSDVEVSTFCAYCGQPTVVFDRVSSIKRPEYIIPFSVSKEKAVWLIREHIGKSSFVPKEIKNFEVERVRGIYIPFWLYDVEYSDTQFLSGEVYSPLHNERKEYFMRKAQVTFYDIMMDASKQLDSSVTQRLEPFDTSKMVPFHSAYLSGFYADCFDYNAHEMESYVTYRCRNLFDEEIKQTINADMIELEAQFPQYNVTNRRYALLPAWFVTFRHGDMPYTIMVNGQTQKVVGAVPYSKRLAIPRVLATTAAIMCIVFPIMYFLCQLGTKIELAFWEYFFTLLLIIIGVVIGNDEAYKLNKGIERSKKSTTNKFAKDRQEG